MDDMDAAFLALWNQTPRVKRAEIAKHFGKSLHWVQWMYERTGAPARNKTPGVCARRQSGVDQRLEMRARYRVRASALRATRALVGHTQTLEQMDAASPEGKRVLRLVENGIRIALGWLVTLKQRDPESRVRENVETAVVRARAAIRATRRHTRRMAENTR